MSVKKFKFVSPGIFLAEIDNSQLPAAAEAMGPVIIGRTRFGPGMTPIKVNSFSEFVQIFGDPVPGGGGQDVWREGNTVGPTYAAYAAQAYLRADVGPVTMFRLLGETNPNAANGTGDETAGWITNKNQATTTADNGGAYGLLVFNGTSTAATGTLAAVFYLQEGAIALSGTLATGGTAELAGALFENIGESAEFMLSIYGTDGPAAVDSAPVVTGPTAGPYALTTADDIDFDVDDGGPTTATVTATQAISASNEGSMLSYGANSTFTYTLSDGIPRPVTMSGISDGKLATIVALNDKMVGVSVDDDGGGDYPRYKTDMAGLDAEITFSLLGDDIAEKLGIVAGTTNGGGNVGDLDAVTAAEIAGLIETAGAIIAAGFTATAVANKVVMTGPTAGAAGSIEIVAGAIMTAIGLTARDITGATTPGSSPVYKTAINFDDTSDKWARNVLNTNPMQSNTAFVDTDALRQGEDLYWLGESYESNLKQIMGDAFNEDGSDGCYGMIVALMSGTTYKQDYKQSSTKNQANQARTGWFFSQDRGATGSYAPGSMPKLFKIHARDGGRWVQDNLKVSISSVKASTNDSNPYGSFNVILRQASDTDNVVEVVEQFTNLNLNPNSENYIGRKIGDRYSKYSYSDQITRLYGAYTNQSKYIRVEMNPDLERGLMDPVLLPFGVTGPPRFKTLTLQSGSTETQIDSSGSFIEAGNNIPLTSSLIHDGEFAVMPTAMAAEIVFPKTLLRHSASDGGIGDPKNAYFGYQSTRAPTDNRFDNGAADYLWPMPAGLTTFDTLTGLPSGEPTEYQWLFSLDDVLVTGTAGADNDVFWQEDARKDGLSYTSREATGYKAILKAGYDRFSSPLFGGIDGLNIIEAEPFRNGFLEDGTETSNYAFNSIQRAINTMADPEYVECNLITIPGVTNNQLTQRLLDVATDRADTLAIIDLPLEFIPFTDSPDPLEDRILTSVDNVIDNLQGRGINTSYGCAYYPWVQIRDSIRGNLLWVPPSVVALGTFASSEGKSEVWFAPAGFNRGGLTEGSAGLTVLLASTRVVSKDRDKLYEANINPIASFPSEGIVVFGQKTLQVTQSALDRINVRRLLIYIKKEISKKAAGILFDQNVQTTWNRFLGEVNPFLASVQARLGLTEFKVILDNTTTTPDLIDQNVLYAKIFLKPARAIEFIAIDFVITRTGAAFVD